MQEHLNFYIDGAWVPPVKPATRDVINPATEKPIARISMGGAEDVDKAVKAARARVRELVAHDARGAHRAAREDRRRLPDEVRGDRQDDLDRDGRADLALEGRAGRDRPRATSRRRSTC